MTDHTRPLPPKKEIAIALLQGGPSMFVHLDPRRPGVVVPKSFTGQPQLILQLGLNMPIPIPDFKLDDDGMSCTLSFNRVPFWCRLPWSAIYALVGEDGHGMVWASDVPPDASLPTQRAPAPQKPSKKPRAKLSAVQDRGTEAPVRLPSKGRARTDTHEPQPAADERGQGPDRSAPRRLPVPQPALATSDDHASAGEPRKPKPVARPVPNTPARKSKRELPPYLRVIK